MKRTAFHNFPVFTMLAVMLTCSSSDLHKGAVALELGDYEMAIDFFSRALRRNPADFEARVGMGKALLQRSIDNGDDTLSWKKALMHLEAARAVNGSSEVTKLLSQAWAERASDILHLGDTLAALEMLTRAIEVDPYSAQPLNLAGIIYFRMGRTDKARLLFDRAVKADTGDPSLLFNLGMLYWEEKRVKEAYELWLRALKKKPEDGDFLYWFAAAEKRIRDTVEAAVPSSERADR